MKQRTKLKCLLSLSVFLAHEITLWTYFQEERWSVFLLCVKHKSDPPPVYCFFLNWDQLTSNSVATRCYYRSSTSVCTPLNFLKGIYIMFFVTSYLSVLAELQFFLITLSICFTLIRDLSSLKFYLTET